MYFHFGCKKHILAARINTNKCLYFPKANVHEQGMRVCHSHSELFRLNGALLEPFTTKHLTSFRHLEVVFVDFLKL